MLRRRLLLWEFRVTNTAHSPRHTDLLFLCSNCRQLQCYHRTANSAAALLTTPRIKTTTKYKVRTTKTLQQQSENSTVSLMRVKGKGKGKGTGSPTLVCQVYEAGAHPSTSQSICRWYYHKSGSRLPLSFCQVYGSSPPSAQYEIMCPTFIQVRN